MNNIQTEYNQPNIIAIDTTVESCSVALYYKCKKFLEINSNDNQKIQIIFPMIKKLLNNSKAKLNELNLLAYCKGPGSFTGIKLTTCIAHGLTFGLNIPMIGISSLFAIAQGVYKELGIKNILVAIDAKMGEMYCAFYTIKSNNYWIGEKTECILKPKEFINIINNKLTGDWAIAGSGWKNILYPNLYKQIKIKLYQSNINSPNAKNLLSIALKEWRNNNLLPAGKGMPNYLRNKVCIKNKFHK